MGTTLSDLAPRRGAKRKRKRLGRGPGTGQGTTGGKGQKGQLCRRGVTLGRSFEGGQMPLNRRLPKFGFRNIFRVEHAPVNVGRLAELFQAGDTVDADALRARGVMPRSARLLKVLGGGELSAALTVRAHAFSAAARAKIEAAGGRVELAVRVKRDGQTVAEQDEQTVGEQDGQTVGEQDEGALPSQ